MVYIDSACCFYPGTDEGKRTDGSKNERAQLSSLPSVQLHSSTSTKAYLPDLGPWLRKDVPPNSLNRIFPSNHHSLNLLPQETIHSPSFPFRSSLGSASLLSPALPAPCPRQPLVSSPHMAPPPVFIAPSPPLPGPAHTTDAEAIVQALESDVRLGLSDAKALELKTTYGLNQIKPPAKPSVSLPSPRFFPLSFSCSRALDELAVRAGISLPGLTFFFSPPPSSSSHGNFWVARSPTP